MDWFIEMKMKGGMLIAAIAGDLNENDYRAGRERVHPYIEGIYCVLFDIHTALLRIFLQ